jgi:DNA replication protein DnaC
MTQSIYEQLKDDLGHLKLTRAAEVLPMGARLRFAHFPVRRTLDEFDFDFSRRLTANSSLTRDPTLCDPGHPVLLPGQPGCGKTHLAIALATLAVEAGYRGYFTSAADLVATITSAYADGTYTTKIRTYTGPSVLVIDDVGLTPLDRAAAILDRLLHQAVVINIKGPSWRMREHQALVDRLREGVGARI